MSTLSFNHIGSAMRGYLATIYLGLFLANSLVPQGYMPLINHEGLVQIVACTGTDAKVSTEAGANVGAYDCPFSLPQTNSLPRAESIWFPAGNSLLEPLTFITNLRKKIIRPLFHEDPFQPPYRKNFSLRRDV